jgi:uncharacterized protein (TIGR02145 family)
MANGTVCCHHPSRQAAAYCEECGKGLCKECYDTIGTRCCECLRKMVDATASEIAKVGVPLDEELTKIIIFSVIGLILGIIIAISGEGFSDEQSIKLNVFMSLQLGGLGGVFGYSIAKRQQMIRAAGQRGLSEVARDYSKYVMIFYLIIGFFVGIIFTLVLILTRLGSRKICSGIISGEYHALLAMEDYLQSELDYDKEKLRWAVNIIVSNFALTRKGVTVKSLKNLKVLAHKEYIGHVKTTKPTIEHGTMVLNNVKNKHVHTQSVEKHDNGVSNQLTEQQSALSNNRYAMPISSGIANEQTQENGDDNAIFAKSTEYGDELFSRRYAIAMLRKQTQKNVDEKDCFIDKRDGQKYRTVTIGDQVWMAENLNYKVDNSWSYDNDESKCGKYGRLYTWEAAMTACPSGWRLPSRDEWNKLVITIGDSSVVGKKLKTTTGWGNNGNGTDNYGFSALPGGYRVAGGKFGGIGDYGNWWTASWYDDDNAYIRSIQYKSDKMGESLFKMDCGFSIRCIQKGSSSGVKKMNNATKYVDRGNEYKENGELDKAIAEYSEAIRVDPNYADAYYCRGIVYIAIGSHDEAIADANKVIQLDHNYALAYYIRGLAYGAKGDCDNAIANHTESILLDPANAKVYCYRGLAYGFKGDYDKAIVDLAESIRLDPTDAMWRYYRGLTYGIMGDYDKAIVDFTESIRLDPTNTIAYSSRGGTYEVKGDYENAIADCTKAIQLNPNDANAFASRSMAYGAIGDHDKAFADCKNAIRCDPDCVPAYYSRGFYNAQFGHVQEAIHDFEKVLEFAPNDGMAALARDALRELRTGKKINKFNKITRSLFQ